MFPLLKHSAASKVFFNLLALPAVDILNLFLLITALCYLPIWYNVASENQNLVLACLVEVVNVHFWHWVFSSDLDLRVVGVRRTRPEWIEPTSPSAGIAVRLVRSARERWIRLSAILTAGFDAIYRACNELRVFSFIVHAYSSVVSILIGLHPNTAFEIWRLVHMLHFLRTLTHPFEDFLFLLWIRVLMNNTKRPSSWRSRFASGIINLSHVIFYGTELGMQTQVEELLPQLQELHDEIVKDTEFFVTNWGVSLPTVRLFGRVIPVSSTQMHLLVETILNNRPSYRALLASKAGEAQMALDILQKVLDSRDTTRGLRLSTRYGMIRLCTMSGTFPQRLILRNIHLKGREPHTSGGCSEIWEAMYGNIEVSLKVAKLTQRSDNERLMRDIAREAILWSQLEHPNILPFFGVHPLGDSYGRIALVSPWEENGNISHYLENNMRVPRFPLVLEILTGLQYLHDHNIVHGDLKGANILISSSGHVRLADFGLSSVVDANVLRWTSLPTLTRSGGTIRWMAPELLGGLGDLEIVRPTFASDVYSFASVAYEILTGQLPFHEVRGNVTVMSRIIQGVKPTIPSFIGLELSNEIWMVMDSCWNYIPDGRPGLSQVTNALRNVSTPELTTQRILDWNAEDQATTPLQAYAPLEALGGSQFTVGDVMVLAKYLRQ